MKRSEIKVGDVLLSTRHRDLKYASYEKVTVLDAGRWKQSHSSGMYQNDAGTGVKVRIEARYGWDRQPARDFTPHDAIQEPRELRGDFETIHAQMIKADQRRDLEAKRREYNHREGDSLRDELRARAKALGLSAYLTSKVSHHTGRVEFTLDAEELLALLWATEAAEAEGSRLPALLSKAQAQVNARYRQVDPASDLEA